MFNARTSRGAVSVLGLWLIALLVGGCTGRNVEPGDRDYPQTNRSPEKFLFIHGTIDPALELRFRIEWWPDNRECVYARTWVSAHIEGGRASYLAWSELPVQRHGSDFNINVPIDGVQPGRCRWHFGLVTFRGAVGFQSTLVASNSYPLKPGQSPNGIATLSCGWKTEPGSVEGGRGIQCRWPKDEDKNASVLGGVLWWHPEARDLEVHFVVEKERN